MITFFKSIFKTILLKPIYNLLMAIVWLVPGQNLGVSIIILTLIIRLALYPTSAQSISAQKKMKDLQPELDKIKLKYKDNKEEEAKATMALYQRYKINPLSSCLPMLLQFPILIILYYALRISLDTSRFDLLYSFTPRPEIINPIFLGINLAEPSIYLAVISGIFQFIQSKMMMPKQKASDKKDDKKGSQSMMQNILSNQMTYFFPILTIYIGTTIPAALTLYWLVTIIFSIVQQYLITKKQNKSGINVQIRSKND